MPAQRPPLTPLQWHDMNQWKGFVKSVNINLAVAVEEGETFWLLLLLICLWGFKETGVSHILRIPPAVTGTHLHYLMEEAGLINPTNKRRRNSLRVWIRQGLRDLHAKGWVKIMPNTINQREAYYQIAVGGTLWANRFFSKK